MQYIAGGERCGSVAELFGRGVELQRIARFLDRAQHSGDTRLIRGEPGVGKSALLDAAADQAHAAGILVFRASGAEFEADVSYCGSTSFFSPCATSWAAFRPERRTPCRSRWDSGRARRRARCLSATLRCRSSWP